MLGIQFKNRQKSESCVQNGDELDAGIQDFRDYYAHALSTLEQYKKQLEVRDANNECAKFEIQLIEERCLSAIFNDDYFWLK